MLSLALALWTSCLSSCVAGVDDSQVIDADDDMRVERMGRSLEAIGCSGPGTSQRYRVVTKAFLVHVTARGDDDGSKHWVVIDGKPDNRLDITSGCPFFYGMIFNETIRLSLVRPDENHYLVAEWSRSPDDCYAKVVAELSWKTEPRDPMSQWPSNHSITSLCVDGQTTFSPLVESDVAAKSFYQKSSLGEGLPAWHYGDKDPMYIDLQAIRSSYVEITGHWRFSFVNASHSGLREDQYAPMEKLFKNNCEPFRDSTSTDRAGSQALWHSAYSSAKSCRWMRVGWDEIRRKRGSPFECDLLEGVLCDDDGYITHIDLSGQGLQGKVDYAIGLDHLARLEVLDLKNNFLDGSLTNFMQVPPSMRILELSGNNFSGSIPNAIGSWTHLHMLALDHNRLSGMIPSELSTLKSLTSLTVSTNALQGFIPDAIGCMTRMASLSLSANRISGAIPDAICFMTRMASLSLSANRLSGAIPDAIGCMARMASLNLSANQISGRIPDATAALQNLVSLDLSANHVSEIPGAIIDLQMLVLLDLSMNRLSGDLSRICSGHYPLLRQLRLSSNRLSGTIPPHCINEADVTAPGTGGERWLPWQNVVELDLSSNRFSGTLPTFGSLTRLQTLRLGKNHFEQGSKSVDELLRVPHEHSLQGPHAVVNLDFILLGRLPRWVLDLHDRKVASATSCSCEMMPRPISINATSAWPGEALDVEVCNMWLAGPPRCKFFRKSHEVITNATVLEPTYDGLTLRLQCIVPESLHAILENEKSSEWKLTVADFGSEFTSEHFLENFHPPTFVLGQIDKATAHPKPKTRFGAMLFILVIIIVLALLKLGHHLYIRRRQRMKELQPASYDAFNDNEELPGRTLL